MFDRLYVECFYICEVFTEARRRHLKIINKIINGESNSGFRIKQCE